MADELHVLMLEKGCERYIFSWTIPNTEAVLQAMGRFASNPELSFSWYDAAVLCQRVRQKACEAAEESIQVRIVE